MKKLWPTLVAMVLTAAIAAGICTFCQATRPVLPDGVQALLRCKKRPFSRKAGMAPNDCYEIMFDAGRPELYVLYLDWNGGGYFYDISTTSSYALDGQGDAFREIVDRMLAE